MNTYGIGIIGSWWLVVLFIIVAVGLSIFLYRNPIPPLSPRQKILLITLRSLALASLLFVIFEPVLTIISGSQESPLLKVVFDNSISVSIKDAKKDRSEQYKQVFQNLDFGKMPKNDVKFSIFDAEVKDIENISYNALTFKGQLTDISKAIKYAAKETDKTNIKAMLQIGRAHV